MPRPSKTSKLLKSLSSRPQIKTPIATDMFLPNHSGDHSKGRVNTTPTTDLEIANKKYVDDNDSDTTDHTAFSNIGTNTHAQIDTHIGDSSDPHGATLTQTNITTTNNIKSMPHYLDKTLIDPNGVYDIDAQVFLMWAPAALTVTKIQVELDANPLIEPTGDFKYADDFITLANPVIINDWDTAAGKRTDTSITSGSVASGKAIYLQFDTTPSSTIKQMHIHMEWDFD